VLSNSKNDRNHIRDRALQIPARPNVWQVSKLLGSQLLPYLHSSIFLITCQRCGFDQASAQLRDTFGSRGADAGQEREYTLDAH
jgi:hypothetical protein